jgi:hypothetical protein
MVISSVTYILTGKSKKYKRFNNSNAALAGNAGCPFKRKLYLTPQLRTSFIS